MHQVRFWLGLCPRPRWGSLQRSPRPSWIMGLRGPTSPRRNSSGLFKCTVLHKNCSWIDLCSSKSKKSKNFVNTVIIDWLIAVLRRTESDYQTNKIIFSGTRPSLKQWKVWSRRVVYVYANLQSLFDLWSNVGLFRHQDIFMFKSAVIPFLGRVVVKAGTFCTTCSKATYTRFVWWLCITYGIR